MSTTSNAAIAIATVSGVTMLASLGVGIASFKKVKTHHDPVRQGLKWVAPALTCLFLGTVLQFTSRVIDLSGSGLGYRVTPRMAIMGSFFLYLATIGLFLALLEISLGILTMWHRAPKRVVGMRKTSWAIAFVMLLLDVAYMIGSLVTAVSTSFYVGIFGTVAFTLQCLYFVALCWVLGMMILVAKRAKANRRNEGLQGGHKILLLYYAAVCVAWFGSIWVFINIGTSLGTFYSTRYSRVSPTIIVSTISSLLLFLTPLVSLTLLFVLGARRQGGLWTATLPK